MSAWLKHFQGAVPPEDGPVPALYTLVWKHFGSEVTDADMERVRGTIDVHDAETLEVRL